MEKWLSVCLPGTQPRLLLFASSEMSDGNMSRHVGDHEEAENNRLRYVSRFDLQAPVFQIDPRHSSNIAVVHEDGCEIVASSDVVVDGDRTMVGHFDAALVDYELHSLSITTADCLPVLFYSKASRFICLAHIGLLGLANGLPEKIIAVFSRLGIRPADLAVALGPSIAEENYDLKQSGLWHSIRSQVEESSPDILDAIYKVGNGAFLDLVKVLRNRCSAAGMRPSAFLQSEVHADGIRYFSHSAAKQGFPRGNFLTVAGVKKSP